MNTGIGLERKAQQPASRFLLKAVAFSSILLVLIFAYAVYVTVAAGARINTAWVDTTIFSGAILCVSFDKSRIGYVIGSAFPFFCLAEFFRVPAPHAAMLTLGCGGVIVLAYYATKGNQLARQNLLIAVALPLFTFLANMINSEIAHHAPDLFDAILLRTDFGVSAAMRRWTLASPLRLSTVDLLYGALPLAAAGVIAYTTGPARGHLLRALCLAPLLAIPFYLLIPAVGPAHVGQPYAFRNCMPSLHLTWAALLWLNARAGWVRRLALAFTLVTVITTLATGEHYVLDLVAAVPFTWVVQQLSEPALRLGPVVRGLTEDART